MPSSEYNGIESSMQNVFFTEQPKKNGDNTVYVHNLTTSVNACC